MIRRLLALSVTASLLWVIPTAGASHDVPVLPNLFPKISAIVNPLSGAPAILEDGATLRVELAPEKSGILSGPPTALLKPSFGAARSYTLLTLLDWSPVSSTDSALWQQRTVYAFDFEIPALTSVFTEDLYDLHVTWYSGGLQIDTQHRSVKVVDTYPTSPRFVVLADPSVGDPRPIQEGAEDLQRQDTDSIVDKTTKTVGNPMNEDRWAALNRAIDEINLLRPDFVLVAGDLTFAIYPRAINWEYEDAFRILARLQVPAYLSPGNHDLYHLEYDNLDRPWLTDGWELWQSYFGPLYYARDLGTDLRLVSLNTFDWPKDQREPFDENDEFSTRAGGQIQAPQLSWLDAELTATRAANPGGQIITLAHHDPSWIQARHPWAGINRLEARDLMAVSGVGAHFAGHSHEDRVARYFNGDVVETNGRKGTKNIMQRILRNNVIDNAGFTQADFGAIIHDPSNGPVFVTTTTVSSVLKGSDWGLGSYWGYRYGQLRARPGGGYDPIDFGYPATREFLDAHAERPEWYNPAHAEFGVYSYASYELDFAQTTNDGTASEVQFSTTSRLLADVDLTVRFSVRAGESTPLDIVGGTMLRRRQVGDVADVEVLVHLPAGTAKVVTVSTASP